MAVTASCERHPERLAAGACERCGARICLACAASTTPEIVCRECDARREAREAARVIALPGAPPVSPPAAPVSTPPPPPMPPAPPPSEAAPRAPAVFADRCSSCGAPRTPDQVFCTACGAKLPKTASFSAPAPRPAAAPAATPPASAKGRAEAIRTPEGKYRCPKCLEDWETLYCPACAMTLLAPGTREREEAARAAAQPLPPGEPPPVPAPAPEALRAALDATARAWGTQAPAPSPAALYGGAETAPLANLAVRGSAFLVDAMLVWGVGSLLGPPRRPSLEAMMWEWGGGPEPGLLARLGVSAAAKLAFLFAVVALVAIRGQSPGKYLLGIRVVDERGRPPGWARAILRETLGKFVSTLLLGFGFAWAAADPRRQALHDKMAGTFVVAGHPPKDPLPPAPG